MTSPPSPDDRRRQLHQLATAWGVTSPTPLPSLAPAALAATFRTPNDDFFAEELLKRRQVEAGQHRASQSSLRRAFTGGKKSGWAPPDIFKTLDAHVESRGSPGVAEVLITKLMVAGGDFNAVSARSRTSLITRRRSLESLPERGRVLAKAVENRQVDMVSVLVRHADHAALDGALPMAIRARDVPIVELLLRHGASAAQTAAGQDAFRQICISGGHPELVGLVLQSDGRPPASCISQCMVDAAQRGCMETVLRLSRSTADGNHDDARALKAAIAQGRVDIVLALLTGVKPPTGRALDQAFRDMFSNTSITPNEKLALARGLLCAGVSGDVVSDALVQACELEFLDMVDLLVSHGASVEYQDAIALRSAVSKARLHLVQSLVTSGSSLSRANASQCVSHVPKAISSEDRYTLLKLLLRKGAGGPPVHDALIDAVEAADAKSVNLLLAPSPPQEQPSPSRDTRLVPRKPAYSGLEAASVDHRGGLALQVAVARGDVPMVRQLMAGRPSLETLADIFPQIPAAPPTDRHQMAESFLAAGLTGPCVSQALQEAIGDETSQRDERFISLLLDHGADVDSDDGAGIPTAIAHEDVGILRILLSKRPRHQAAAAGILKAVAVDDPTKRYDMVNLLIGAGAAQASTETSAAMVQVLQRKPVDARLLDVLLDAGEADANFTLGAPVIHAARDGDPAILELVVRKGKPTPETLAAGLATLAELPTDSPKIRKFKFLLQRFEQAPPLGHLLAREVQTLFREPREGQDLAVLRLLLSSGADVNFQKGAALCLAISAASAAASDLLFAARPNSTSLAACLPHALNISDPMDRLIFTKRLVDAGAPSDEVNRALVHAVNVYADDISLIRVLSAGAAPRDDEALGWAIRRENPDVLEVLLGGSPEKHAAPLLNSSLAQAVKVKDRDRRLRICRLLLDAGASNPAASDALLAAASDGDLSLGKLLLSRGASTEHRDGQAVVEACRSGAAHVLEMLLASGAHQVDKHVLAKGFQAATEVGDLGKRADLFRILLDKGTRGEVVDAQLVSAARFGDKGTPLLRLLLEHGADVNYNSGEAVWTATRSAMMGNLALLLSVERTGDRQKKPSKATLAKALKASWWLSREPRYQVLSWVFEVGQPVSEDEVHTALRKAVKNDPDLRLIRLLLSQGASPTANGCQSLIEAAQNLLADVLAIFLEGEVSETDLSWTFKETFTPATAGVWLSEQGYQVAKQLLDKGARGDAVSAALSITIDASNPPSDGAALPRDFTRLLVRHADVNFEDGLVLQKAARLADPEIIQLVLELKPSSHTVSMAFPYIFESSPREDDALGLIGLLADYHDGTERLDDRVANSQSVPILFRAVTLFPRSAKVLQALLDAGFYHDQMGTALAMAEAEEEEPVSFLLWALLQPQKRVSDGVIELLISRNANVNFETHLSKVTPLMVAVQSRRKEIVRSLILAGAEVDVTDVHGRTPLAMATEIGGDLGTIMMSNILAADPCKNDGSLHNAACGLSLHAVQVLVDFGHDLDFPSPIHDGRSALAELCLHAGHTGTITAAREKQMEKIMTYLVDRGTDLSLRSDGKSSLLLCFESCEPLTTTRALLRAGMWKHINQPFNHFTDGTYTYSPTQYLTRVLPPSSSRPALLALLRANRAEDVYYAVSGPQPADALNAPEFLLEAERARLARAERLAAEAEDHALALARAREVAATHEHIAAERAAVEEARTARQAAVELEAGRARLAAEGEAFAAEMRRRSTAREAELRHERALAEAGAAKVRALTEAEGARQERLLEWERRLGGERARQAREMGAARLKEREDLDRLETEHERRVMGRISEQRRLVESQNVLAGKLTAAGVGKQGRIGFITGEVE